MTTEIKTTVTLTDDNFRHEVLESQEPVLVDFWADWCGPCHMIAPVLQEIASEYAGRVKIAKLNVDENAATAAQYGIRSIPTLFFFKRGRIADQAIGVLPKRELVAKLNGLL
ncbi:MAG: thioredoxin [bacterium]